MGDKLTRVEIRVADRIVYAKDVESVSIDSHDGRMSLLALEPGHGALTAPDNPLLPEGFELIPPAPTPGAPDGDDEPTGDEPQVLERVHTGEEYAKAEHPRRTRKAKPDEPLPATVEVDGVEVPPADAEHGDAVGQVVHVPTGTVMDGVISIDPGTAADLMTDTELPAGDAEGGDA